MWFLCEGSILKSSNCDVGWSENLLISLLIYSVNTEQACCVVPTKAIPKASRKKREWDGGIWVRRIDLFVSGWMWLEMRKTWGETSRLYHFPNSLVTGIQRHAIKTVRGRRKIAERRGTSVLVVWNDAMANHTNSKQLIVNFPFSRLRQLFTTILYYFQYLELLLKWHIFLLRLFERMR